VSGVRLGLLLALAALGLAVDGNAAAADVRVMSAHAPATGAGATTGATYLGVHNVGATADRLLRASTPLAARVEFHRSQLDGAVMRMRQVEALELPVGGSIEMSTGGTHLMLIGLKRALKAGEQFPLRLEFARAGVVDTTVTVLRSGGTAPAGASRP
jgi:hypothetical protein